MRSRREGVRQGRSSEQVVCDQIVLICRLMHGLAELLVTRQAGPWLRHPVQGNLECD